MQGPREFGHCVEVARTVGHDGLVSANMADLGSALADIHDFDQAERYLTGILAYTNGQEDGKLTAPTSL